MKGRTQVGFRADDRREQVRARYARIALGRSTTVPSAKKSDCCGGGSAGSCCEGSTVGIRLGYPPADLESLPEGANLGLGCGNPTGLASLRPGEVVLDLGSGAGIDCFLAARKVGIKGRIIGVDMTPEMLAKARDNARRDGFENVEFRLGEIEHLPVADESVHVVISNCAINLAPDKGQVYREAFRVLRPAGRFAVSDVVATSPITSEQRADPSLWSSCSSGALEVKELRALLREAGFENIRIDLKTAKRTSNSMEQQSSLGVVSADVRATKPVVR